VAQFRKFSFRRLSMLARVWDRAFAQKVDELSIQDFGIPPEVLMERAGLAVADFVCEGSSDWDEVVILAGAGNNGGDGLVVARELLSRGIPVSTFTVSRLPAKYTEACRRQRQILEKLGHSPSIYSFGCLQRFKPKRVLIVDAILGLGFVPPLADGPIRDALTEAAALPQKRVVAIDLPSGLDADGWNSECLLPADFTVTFGGIKACQLIEPNRKHQGQVIVRNPGFPAMAAAAAEKSWPAQLFLANETIPNPLRHLPRDAHKYDRGHVVIIGGSQGKYGAPLLSGMAAARAGAGWVTIACAPAEIRSQIEPLHPELTFESLGMQAFENLADFVTKRKVRAVVLGPGWMDQKLDQEILARLSDLQKRTHLRIVLDAGATKNLEAIAASQSMDPALTIATPHPGEWTRLFNQMQPFQSLADAKLITTKASALGISLIYKGATPTVFAPGLWQDCPMVVTGGSNTVAKAGAGDVLSGIIAAHSMHTSHIGEAATSAIQTFYRAGKMAALALGPDGVLPSDLLQWIGVASDT
jgi:NAD(P)H-hydrate epimerase